MAQELSLKNKKSMKKYNDMDPDGIYNELIIIIWIDMELILNTLMIKYIMDNIT